MSFVLLKLRKSDPDAVRPFKIPGKVLPVILAVLHAVLLVIGVIGFVLPTEGSNPVTYVATIVIGIVASQIVGEILMSVAAKKKGGAKEDRYQLFKISEKLFCTEVRQEPV